MQDQRAEAQPTQGERRRQDERRRRPRGGRRITDLTTHEEVHVRVSQVMAYFNVGRRTVLKWIENGDLPALKIESQWRFKTSDILRLDEKLRHRPSA